MCCVGLGHALSLLMQPPQQVSLAQACLLYMVSHPADKWLNRVYADMYTLVLRRLHPAVTEAGMELDGDEEQSVQEAYTPDSQCFGCGARA